MTDQNPTPVDSSEPAGAPTTPIKKAGRKRWITPLLGVVAALAIGLFGGILIGHNTASANQAGGPAGFRGGAAGGGTAQAARANFTSGTIESIEGDSITLKLTDGSTLKVTTGSDTAVSKTEKSTVDDLAKGDRVAVVGKADANGDVAATSVSEGATVGGFGGGGRTPPTGTPTGN
ncbi:DUF5666 domain-containing protein [Glaciihabitans sp. UYNi722]|uniref:DUF5666 domain-containing protein n=1 Tax=Glaciihabitans sp. UYNi722 TaxID=3156344 RepID=UPI0033924D3E